MGQTPHVPHLFSLKYWLFLSPLLISPIFSSMHLFIRNHFLEIQGSKEDDKEEWYRSTCTFKTEISLSDLSCKEQAAVPNFQWSWRWLTSQYTCTWPWAQISGTSRQARKRSPITNSLRSILRHTHLPCLTISSLLLQDILVPVATFLSSITAVNLAAAMEKKQTITQDQETCSNFKYNFRQEFLL